MTLNVSALAAARRARRARLPTGLAAVAAARLISSKTPASASASPPPSRARRLLPVQSSKPLLPPKAQQSVSDALSLTALGDDEALTRTVRNAELRRALPTTWPGTEPYLALLDERRTLLARLDEARSHGKSLRADSSRVRTKDPARFDELRGELRRNAAEVKDLDERAESLFERATALRLEFPNFSDPSSPEGPEEKAVVRGVYRGVVAAQSLPDGERRAVEAARGGELTLEDWQAIVGGQADTASTPSPSHLDLAAKLPLQPSIDLDAGRAATGPSYPFLLGSLAMLEQALIRHALSLAIARGFSLVSPPVVVKTDIAERCGFKPRQGRGGQTYFVMSSSTWADDVVGAQSGGEVAAPGHCLVGTAEISLGALVSSRNFQYQLRDDDKDDGDDPSAASSSDLPLRLLAITPSFRAEDGGRGTETKGLYRLHQFQKAEMFIVAPASTAMSNTLLNELLSLQRHVLTSLNLTHRILDMPTEELGAAAYKKYDIEAWMPGRGTWGEVSSASNCTDYQSSRLHIRHRALQRKPDGTAVNTTIPAHTLNATLCAVPRLIIAIMEQYGLDEERGRLRLPAVLKEHWLSGSGADDVEWVEAASGEQVTTASPSVGEGKRAYHTAVATARGRRPSHQGHEILTTTPSARSLSSSFSRPSISPSSRRWSSTSPQSSTLYSRLRGRLTALSTRTGTDPASLTASFLILHELTALAPLVILFYAFGALGVGAQVCEWFIQAARVDGTVDDATPPASAWRRKIGEWLQEGITRTERYAKRKGWWGYERDGNDGGSGDVKTGEQAQVTSTRMAGAMANAVAAYVVTKVSSDPDAMRNDTITRRYDGVWGKRWWTKQRLMQHSIACVRARALY